ncbi:MAG TPA: YheE family protein [Pseudoneobacillus sp.]|nr:YheE family protein [Pseudoneobacillus sp.]
MITHFQYKSIYQHEQLPGWTFSFYFQKQKFSGVYHQNGLIEWTSNCPNTEDETLLKGQIHELMLFHVYDK